MKFTDFQRKTISLIVLAAFVALLHFWATPVAAAPSAGNSETAMAQGDNGGPGFIEEEGESNTSIKKEKKFPWLIVGLGVVAVGVAVYFLVIKKPKYTLNVTLGSGCTGTPAVNATYKKGTVVNYNYTPQTGYGNLQVKLDGVDVPAAGTVTMDKDKALAVSAQLQRTLAVTLGAGCTGTPAATTVYNDGTAVNYSYSAQTGYGNLQVKIDSMVVPASGTVTMNANKALTVTAQIQRFTLNIAIGAGCTGTPAASAMYNYGTVVNYSYALLAGYSNLQVKIDGIAVPASGNITMDRNKALTVTASGATLYDIRGTWSLNYHWNSNSGYASQTFSGTSTSGITSENGVPDGTYKVNGKNVEWTYYSGTKYTGTFSSAQYMSGTMLSFSGSRGTWSARKISNTPTKNTMTSSPIKKGLNAKGEWCD